MTTKELRKLVEQWQDVLTRVSECLDDDDPEVTEHYDCEATES